MSPSSGPSGKCWLVLQLLYQHPAKEGVIGTLKVQLDKSSEQRLNLSGS